LEFDELRQERKALNDIVQLHEASLWRFKHPSKERSWFYLTTDEEEDEKELRHLSSSASCLESLADIPEYMSTRDNEMLAQQFASTALGAPDERWESERAAQVYCRVRTLVPLLTLAPAAALKNANAAITEKLELVWNQVQVGDPTSQGIAELPEKQEEESKPEVSYPPNAYLTYWGVRQIEEYIKLGGLKGLPTELLEKRATAELWAKQVLGAQTARILNGAERTDPHQLAWALSLELLHADLPSTTAASPRLEVQRSALRAFFLKQEESGDWPLSEPLFHYPAAGNAYCYTFETLTALLRPALDEKRGVVARQLLHPHLEGLLDAWRFADRTQISTGDGTIGWCSGHHPHRVFPESWATASVFSFLQALRTLIGFWTDEQAKRALGARRARWSGEAAEDKLRERGRAWVRGEHWSVGRQLAALFLHPIRSRLQPRPSLDPDRPLLTATQDYDQARSAILFGPPGTSKTTLVEALAGAIGWQYVEVHAADFLSEGMDQVPARADEIFANLMELDQSVVLFDEIDELIRKRSRDESDPFGRFLTTSMLPKLAKLWDQRRVLYFVATNDIDAADPAIRRSQRFDAAMFVTPPSFAVKATLLEKEFQLPVQLTEEAVNESLGKKMGNRNTLGVFALLRHDQIAVLAERLHKEDASDQPSIDTVKTVLGDLGDDLAKNEWSDERDHVKAKDRGPYGLFRHLERSEQRDARMLQLLRSDHALARPPEGTEQFDTPAGAPSYFRVRANLPEIDRSSPDERWRLSVDGVEAVDNYLLDFSNEQPPPLDRS
jgi:predicted ATPase